MLSPIAGGAAVTTKTAAKPTAFAPKSHAPKFHLKLRDGDFFLSDYGGDRQHFAARGTSPGPVALDFFAAWRKPCTQKLPEPQAFWDQCRSSGARFFFIDVFEPAEKVAAFLAEEVRALGNEPP